jgi:hypothetical protein
LLGTSPSRAPRRAIAAAALAVLAGCAGDPASGPEARPTAEETVRLGDDRDARWHPDQQAVIDTIDAYSAWYSDSLADASEDDIDLEALRSLATPGYTRDFGRTVLTQLSSGLEIRGVQEFDPREVTVQGDSATVETCWDSSTAEAVLVYEKPERKVAPAPPTLTTFTLDRVGDGWRIADREAGDGC